MERLRRVGSRQWAARGRQPADVLRSCGPARQREGTPSPFFGAQDRRPKERRGGNNYDLRSPNKWPEYDAYNYAQNQVALKLSPE